MIDLRQPWVLLLIPLILGLLAFFYFRFLRASFRFSSSGLLSGLRLTWRMRLRHLPFVLRLLAVALVLVALAGPRKSLEEGRSSREGINIVLLLDTSTSMAAEDFTLNGKRADRLSVVKDAIEKFVEARKSDRLGLIAFAAKPYTVCPLTGDHSWLKVNLERVRFGLMEDGTAIGSAIASGVNRLRTIEGKSKVLILLTDGVNNSGTLEPLQAAEAAKTLGVRIYTIGAGTKGMAPYPVTDMFGRRGYQNVPVEIDEGSLQAIAKITGGQYFRATDTASLKDIYDQIDRLEKVTFEEVGHRQYRELFWYPLCLGLVVLLLDVILGATVFLRIP